jgi:hypothetical protein
MEKMAAGKDSERFFQALLDSKQRDLQTYSLSKMLASPTANPTLKRLAAEFKEDPKVFPSWFLDLFLEKLKKSKRDSTETADLAREILVARLSGANGTEDREIFHRCKSFGLEDLYEDGKCLSDALKQSDANANAVFARSPDALIRKRKGFVEGRLYAEKLVSESKDETQIVQWFV